MRNLTCGRNNMHVECLSIQANHHYIPLLKSKLDFTKDVVFLEAKQCDASDHDTRSYNLPSILQYTLQEAARPGPSAHSLEMHDSQISFLPKALT